MDNFTVLKVFCSLVETQSFTKTAQNLSLSKAAISKHIRKLEERLAISLVKRSTRGINITECGMVYYERISELLKQLMSADDEVRQYENKICGKIKLSVPVSMGLLFITPLLPEFMNLYPDVSIEVVLTDNNVDILNEGFDLVVRVARILPDSNIKSRKIGQFRHIICASPDYLKRYGIPQKPDELTRHDSLIYTGIPTPDKWRFITENSNEDQIIQVTGHYRANNSLALKHAAMQNQGLLTIPDIYIKNELKTGALVSILDNYKIEKTDIWILYPNSQALAQRTRVLIDYLVEKFSTA